MPPPVANDPWLSGRRFGIVIDAGSSGSRLQIYSWKDPRTANVRPGSDLAYTLPKVEKGTKFEGDWVKKVEPGLSSLAETPGDVDLYLKPLIRHAMDQIPPSVHHETPIFLLATAGMRLLPPKQQARVLQETCRFLLHHSSFKIDTPSVVGPCGSSVRIITGEEEGLFGWIAVNYLMDGFTGSSDTRTTFGFLDMGGASTQIAFEPSPDAQHDKDASKNLIDVRLRLMGGHEIRHKVFVTTWLGYGTNQARDRYVGKAISEFEAHRDEDDDEDIVADPCLPKDLTLVEQPVHTSPAPTHLRASHTMHGTGSFEQCLRATAPLLNKNKPCPDANCLMNGVSVPPIDFSVSHFIGISEYWYSSEHIFGLGGAYDFVQYEKAAAEFCSKDWSELLEMHEAHRKKQRLGGDGEVEKDGKIIDTGNWGPKVEIPRLQMQCFKAAWITNVLHEGLGLPRIVDPGGNAGSEGDRVKEEAKKKGLGRPAFQSIDTVNDLAITWTLGKMVLEASKDVPALDKHSRPLADPIDDIDDYEDAPFQPIRPPFLSFAGLEDRIQPHLPSTLSRENLGFSPVLFLFYVVVLFALLLVAFPLRRRLRSTCLRYMHSSSKRDPYGDLLEEGRLGSRPSSPNPNSFASKVPSPFRRFFISSSSRSNNRPLTLTSNLNKTYRNPPKIQTSNSTSSSQRNSPITRSFSTPPNGLVPQHSNTASGSSTNYAHLSSSRSPSPVPGYNYNMTLTAEEPNASASSTSRNGSQMNLANLASRPAALSRMNSMHSIHGNP